MERIKQCPFCGGSTILHFTDKEHSYLQCWDCLCRTSVYERHEGIPGLDRDPEEQAIEAWNRRTTGNEAEIEIVYRKGKCTHYDPDVRKNASLSCTSAFDGYLCDVCDGYESDSDGTTINGFCRYAGIQYGYVGFSTKKYEMEQHCDNFDPHLNCMIVKARGKKYECSKVTLNGKVIYEQDEFGFPIDHSDQEGE